MLHVVTRYLILSRALASLRGVLEQQCTGSDSVQGDQNCVCLASPEVHVNNVCGLSLSSDASACCVELTSWSASVKASQVERAATRHFELALGLQSCTNSGKARLRWVLPSKRVLSARLVSTFVSQSVARRAACSDRMRHDWSCGLNLNAVSAVLHRKPCPRLVVATAGSVEASRMCSCTARRPQQSAELA